MIFLDPIERGWKQWKQNYVGAPANKLEERESPHRATPFGGKENGSNGSSLASYDTDSASKIVSHVNGVSNFEIFLTIDVPQRYTT